MLPMLPSAVPATLHPTSLPLLNKARPAILPPCNLPFLILTKN